jgi:hypothetical protein
MLENKTKQELNMKKADLNNWNVEVDEKNGRKHVFMYFGGKSIMVHLSKDGSSDITVHSHGTDGEHAKVSKKTQRLMTDDGVKFVSKETTTKSRDARVTLVKFSE